MKITLKYILCVIKGSYPNSDVYLLSVSHSSYKEYLTHFDYCSVARMQGEI